MWRFSVLTHRGEKGMPIVACVRTERCVLNLDLQITADGNADSESQVTNL